MSYQNVTLKASGLQTYPNQLTYVNGSSLQSSTPQGSLAQADDVVINRENVIEPRRGFDFYGNEIGSSPTADTAHQQMTYKDTLFRHWGAGPGTTLDWDTDAQGTYDSFSALISEVQQGIRIKYAESNGNLYFTTSSGIQKISVSDSSQLATGSVQPAGIPEGLDITLSLNSAPGFLNQESVVGYRSLWGINDANQNLILGAPSNRQIISNPLTPLLVTNFNSLLTSLDTLNLSTGIHFQDYVNTFGVPVGSSPTLLRGNLIGLATELDNDIASNSFFDMIPNVSNVSGTSNSDATLLVADSTGLSIGQLLTGEAQIAVANVTGTTTLSSPVITATSGFTTEVVPGQLVTTSTAGILPDNTFVVSVDGSLNVTLSSLPITAGTYTSEFIFTNPNPIQDGTLITGISGTALTLNQSTTFSAAYTSAFSFSSIYTQQNLSSSTFAVTIILSSDPSSIIQLNDPVAVSNVVPASYNTITGIAQNINNISGTNNLVIQYSSDPGVYVSGTARVIRYKYQGITLPPALSTDPTSNELVAMQTYYDTIVNFLQVEPAAIITDPSIFDNSGSTKTATVNISFPIPQGITTANFFQIYRTVQTTSNTGTALDTLDPGDEEFLAFEGNPSSGDLTAGFITIQDITPDSFLGAFLYTNANSGTGIASANVPPPLALDIILYKNYMFYANTISFHSVNTSLLGVSAFTPGTSTITITDGTTSNIYTFVSGPDDPATKEVHISSLPTPSQQIAETAQSFVNVINRNPSELVYAFYESGVTGVPGKILLQSRVLGGAAFYLNANSTQTGNSFDKPIPVTGQTVISTNDKRPNRLFFSTQFQPDSVPIINFMDIGPQDKQILRILALRESLFVLKEEGIYRITGQIAPFTVDLSDNSTFLTAPDSASVLNNTIYGLTNQGVVSINDTGVNIISRPIEGSLIVLNKGRYPNFQSATVAIGYESDRTYNLWTVKEPTDTLATQGFRYNTITEAWTNCTKMARSAVVHFPDDKLYIGATDINFIEQERKNFDRTDYADRQFTFTLGPNVISGANVTLSSVANVTVGDVLEQVQFLTIKQFNRLLTKLNSDPGIETNYSGLTTSAGVNLRDSVTSLATQLDSDPGTNTKTYASSISGFGNTFANTQSAFNTIIGLLNNDSGLIYRNYQTSNNTVNYEVPIISIKGNTVTTQYAYPFIQGPIINYNHINSIVTWLPQSFGDPSISKLVADATCIFNKLSFTSADISFSSDLFPNFSTVTFPGPGNGSYGNAVYGNSTYGDSGNSAPLRTYVPRDYQRCRYLNVQFEHGVAREAYQLYGVSLTFNNISQRAWR